MMDYIIIFFIGITMITFVLYLESKTVSAKKIYKILISNDIKPIKYERIDYLITHDSTAQYVKIQRTLYAVLDAVVVDKEMADELAQSLANLIIEHNAKFD